MTRTVHRLRGIAVTAAAWAVIFAVAGGVYALGMIAWLRATDGNVERSAFSVVRTVVGLYAPIGAFGGAAFAALLVLVARRRTLAELRMPAVVALGALAGMAWPLGTLLVHLGEGARPRAAAFALAFCAALGAGSAALMLSLARRGSGNESGVGAGD